MSTTVLVTGSTGTVGSQVLGELAGREGIVVRAAARDLAKAPAGSGVEPVLFDYNRPETFAPACHGVDSLFMVAPFTPQGVEQSQALISAARAAGVRHIVKLSVIARVRGITVGRWHAAIDAAVKSSGLQWTILQPGAFMQNFVETGAPHPDGNIYAPVGDAAGVFIDTRDIAAVAAKAITEPGHHGKEYTLTAAEALTYAEVAAIISAACGRTIRYVDIPEDAARQAMLGAHLPDWLVDVILELNAWSKAGGSAEVTGTVQELLGRPPRKFQEFARDYADVWKL